MEMANKWRVTYDNKVLGHYAAITPQEAVRKSMAAHKDYTDFSDTSKTFTVQRANSVNPPCEVVEVM